MALTPAQKQKQYRQRQKLKAGIPVTDPAPPPSLNLPISGFSDFILASQERQDSVGWILQEIRNNSPAFLLGGMIEKDWEIERTYQSIQCLSTSLETLTAMLSEFRRMQIEKEIVLVKQRDLRNHAKQDLAIARLIQLQKAKERLAKKFRLTLSEYEIPDK